MDYERPWLVRAGLAVIALVVVANAGSRVGLGVSGPARIVTLGVLVYVVAALMFLLRRNASRREVVTLLLVMSAASALTHHGDPTGTGGIGLYLGMAFAPLRLDLRTAAVVSAIGVLIFDAQLALEATDAAVFILVVDGGAAFFFFLGTLLRREAEQRRQVAELLAQLEASREAEKASAALAERSRLAREIHDVLAHTLSGLALHLEGLRLLGRARGLDEELTAALDQAHSLARTGLEEARHGVTALRGRSLPGPEQLPVLVDEHRAACGRPCRLTVTGRAVELPSDASLALYRTAQEALTNVRKHAPSAAVDVRLDWYEELLELTVESRGPQETAHGSGSGYGLAGMRERAELLDGRLTAGPTDQGFRVRLLLPLSTSSSRPGPDRPAEGRTIRQSLRQ